MKLVKYLSLVALFLTTGMTFAQDADAEELLEHGAEDVGLGGGEHADGEEGRKRAVDHVGAHLAHRLLGALVARPRRPHEGVRHVR